MFPRSRMKAAESCFCSVEHAVWASLSGGSPILSLHLPALYFCGIISVHQSHRFSPIPLSRVFFLSCRIPSGSEMQKFCFTQRPLRFSPETARIPVFRRFFLIVYIKTCRYAACIMYDNLYIVSFCFLLRLQKSFIVRLKNKTLMAFMD